MKIDVGSRRKAVTLAEICIVLAVISIVSTLVASFCLMANKRAIASSSRTNILSEVDAIEKIIESFVDGALTENETLRTDGNNLYADTYSVTLNDGDIRATIPGREPITLECSTVETISFELLEYLEDGDTLVFCTVSCRVPSANGENKLETHVFCVNSRLDEGLEVG